MDDDVADLVSTEIRNFFISITTPFLNGLEEKDKQNAVSWSHRLMNTNNYPLMKNYLLLLTFMIVGGRIVSPFDVDSSHCKLPKIPPEYNETVLYNYVRGEIERIKSEDLLEATESALSRDEMAFLAQLPAPKGGFRLYLAMSDTPYPKWSGANKFPVPTKYDVSAKDFANEGLDLVKKKFNSSPKVGGTSQDTTISEKQPAQTNAGIEEQKSKSIQAENLNNTHGKDHSSAYEYDSLLKTPVRKEPRFQILRDKPEVHKCVIEIPPNSTAIIEEIEDLAVDDLPDSPPNLRTEEDFQREENVRMRVIRWFGDPIYARYRETIKKLLRRKIPVDSIRRTIHRCIRQRYKPGTNIPNWLRDSLDDSEPFNIRIAHLKMRFSDVLRNEYGVLDEDELFHLSNVPALSETEECKARELIKRAEEGRVDPTIRRLFATNENRSCKKLMRIIDEIIERDYNPDETYPEPPRNPNDSPQSELINSLRGPKKQWVCDMETSHSVSRKSQRQETGQPAPRPAAFSSPTSNRSLSHSSRDESSRPTVDNQLNNSNECCPAGFRLEQLNSYRHLTNRSSVRETHRKRSTSSEFELSDNSQLEDDNIEDERADTIFANLPPDTSIEDVSNDHSGVGNKSKRKSN